MLYLLRMAASTASTISSRNVTGIPRKKTGINKKNNGDGLYRSYGRSWTQIIGHTAGAIWSLQDRGASSGARPLIEVIQFIELNQVAKYYTTVVTEEEIWWC